ncbi:MAG: response regulator [Planctomycetes bacterium]|nr:response regulator [Planctomycetota bacterium]
MRILVVDDEADTRSLLQDLLEPAGHQVTLAAAASEALVHIQMKKFDLIFLDVMMPGVDGHALAQFLSNQWDTFDIPLVMISCRHDRESKGWARVNGCRRYLEKPFTTTELFDTIDEIERTRVEDPVEPR